MSHWLRLLSQSLNKTGALLVLPALTLLVTVDVVLRYGFNAPLPWALEAAQHLLVLFFIFGLIESFRTGAHVRMSLIADRLPDGAKRTMSVVYAGLILVVFGLLARKAADDIPFFYSLPEVTERLRLRIWIFYALIIFVAIGAAAYVVFASFAVLRGRRIELEEVRGEDHE